MISRLNRSFQFNLSVFFSIPMALILLTSTFGLCEPSFETDRGNREPAVLGPAILEEEEIGGQAESDATPAINTSNDPNQVSF